MIRQEQSRDVSIVYLYWTANNVYMGYCVLGDDNKYRFITGNDYGGYRPDNIDDLISGIIKGLNEKYQKHIKQVGYQTSDGVHRRIATRVH